MNKLLLMIGLVMLLGSSCSKNKEFQGSDNLVTVTRNLFQIKKIVAKNSVRVIIVEGATQKVQVRVNENLEDQLITFVSDNTLNLYLESGSYENATFEVTVEIPNLERLELSDAAQATLDRNAQSLELKVSDGAILDLIGSAQNLTIYGSDAAEINGFAFEAAVVETELEDASTLEIRCNNTLNGVIKDAAQVSYKGNPTINLQVKDAGKVINAN